MDRTGLRWGRVRDCLQRPVSTTTAWSHPASRAQDYSRVRRHYDACSQQHWWQCLPDVELWMWTCWSYHHHHLVYIHPDANLNNTLQTYFLGVYVFMYKILYMLFVCIGWCFHDALQSCVAIWEISHLEEPWTCLPAQAVLRDRSCQPKHLFSLFENKCFCSCP